MLEQLKGRKLLHLSGDDVEVALRFDGCSVTTRAAMTVLESREGVKPTTPPDGDWKDWFETCIGCTVVDVRQDNDELRLVLDDGRELWIEKDGEDRGEILVLEFDDGLRIEL